MAVSHFHLYFFPTLMRGDANSDMQPQIATSLSSGSIHILSDSGNGEFEEEGKISNAHSYEPWIVGFDYWKPKILYTGGDDCLLKMWDTEIGLERPAAVHKK